ncbi:MAG: lactate racemase domain-containing protein, partial [Alphaproteobacteria bacterium]|nr:lactate racemase domain-containing protein [Alphaproteobacteria bacterium]
MADTQTVTIPYESLDPLTIGASDDESKIYRDQLELEIPTGNLVGVVTPNEPAALSNVTEAAREMLENPHSGPRFSELLGPDKSVAIIIDNQFRPTPAAKILPAVLDAIEAAGVTDVRVICANAKVFHMSESEIE